MSILEQFKCSCSGQLHEGPPMDWGFASPAYWRSELAGDPKSKLTSDICIIEGRDFFVRGCLELPVRDADRSFIYGVWVSLSRKNFERMINIESDDDAIRAEPSYFGWFRKQAARLSGYDLTQN